MWGLSKLHMCRRTLAGGREFWLPLPEDWKEKDTQWVSGHTCAQFRWLHHSGGAWAWGRAGPGSWAFLHVISTSMSCNFFTRGCFLPRGSFLKATSVECILLPRGTMSFQVGDVLLLFVYVPNWLFPSTLDSPLCSQWQWILLSPLTTRLKGCAWIYLSHCDC